MGLDLNHLFLLHYHINLCFSLSALWLLLKNAPGLFTLMETKIILRLPQPLKLL